MHSPSESVAITKSHNATGLVEFNFFAVLNSFAKLNLIQTQLTFAVLNS